MSSMELDDDDAPNDSVTEFPNAGLGSLEITSIDPSFTL